MTPASSLNGLVTLASVQQSTGFAHAPDGSRIAYATVGSGPPIVLPAWWVSHVVEDWRFAPLRRFIEGLAAAQIEIDRRMLAELAVSDAVAFKAIVDKAVTALDQKKAA